MSVLYFELPIIILSGLIVINGEPALRQPQLKSMYVVSHIRNRYARTVVSSNYLNLDIHSQETTFSIALPDSAFISAFVMEIRGNKYKAYVHETEEAKRKYQEAVDQGRSAAHVATTARDSNKFTVSVNVEPLSKITFHLTYEELLMRKHGRYEMVINLHPGQLVKELNVNVYLNETRRIIDVITPPLRSGNKITDSDLAETNKYAIIKSLDNNNMTMQIQFKPNRYEQKQIMEAFEESKDQNGLAGQFVVQYHVEQEPQGEVLINDGYFVHFFAPTDLQPIPKHVVFVLDVSGSMEGKKIAQLREAMKSILSELKEGDYFHIVKFHSDVQVLNDKNKWLDVQVPEESKLPAAVPVNKEYIDNAQRIVEQMYDEGATNIYDALLVALRLTSKGTPEQKGTKHTPQPIIVFLTDGEANVKESDPYKIIDMVESKNTGNQKAAIFALSFGNSADKDFLKELAIKNSGFMRHIYEAADASLQLQEFYKQISSPLLTNVTFTYAEDQVNSLTKHNFDILFDGSELVVAGKVANPSDKFVAVHGRTLNGTWNFVPNIKQPEVRKESGNLERLWAYLTIKQLLDKQYEKSDSNGSDEVDTPKKQALNLALQYSFVTPVSSLVVVKPNATETFTVHSQIAEETDDFDLVQDIPLLLYATEIPTTTTEKTISNTTQSLLVELPWLSNVITRFETITVNYRTYLIDNPTDPMVNKRTLCHVKHLNRTGTCTLLAQCQRVYSMISSVDVYNQFFCSLDSDKYAGVCCVNVY